MKFLLQIILIAVLTYLAQLFSPWWIIFVTAALVGFLVPDKGLRTFGAGFWAIAILWIGQSYLIDMANESILSNRMVDLFPVNTPLQLMLATALIGGLCGGFAALTGKLFGDIFKKKKERHTVYS